MYVGWAMLKINFYDYCLKVTCNIATTLDTVYDSKNRLILILFLRAYSSRLSVI